MTQKPYSSYIVKRALDNLQAEMRKTIDNLHFQSKDMADASQAIKDKVEQEDGRPLTAPEKVCLLALDTEYFEMREAVEYLMVMYRQLIDLLEDE